MKEQTRELIEYQLPIIKNKLRRCYLCGDEVDMNDTDMMLVAAHQIGGLEGSLHTVTVFLKQNCKRCGHEWTPRFPQPPKVCPKCKSKLWNKER
jgi:DNA-directed RNA polymerase subunit RPC12/RpoP